MGLRRRPAALIVFVMAAVVVGREARRLDAVAPRVIYNVDEAVEFVSDRLPEASQARLPRRPKSSALRRSTCGGCTPRGCSQTDVADRRQDIDTPTVIDEDTVVGLSLGEAEREGVELLDDVDAVAPWSRPTWPTSTPSEPSAPRVAGDDVAGLD